MIVRLTKCFCRQFSTWSSWCQAEMTFLFLVRFWSIKPMPVRVTVNQPMPPLLLFHHRHLSWEFICPSLERTTLTTLTWGADVIAHLPKSMTSKCYRLKTCNLLLSWSLRDSIVMAIFHALLPTHFILCNFSQFSWKWVWISFPFQRYTSLKSHQSSMHTYTPLT